ncbi:response regulator [Spirosoma taeanense]|uniref:Response regulator n=1 Tax=Spirosoma taeanense TaxID=2735870 RepID=A0A6M5Y7L1_9BACT|nr:response regulator [Spirosoma taeanense]QJW89406.1 response regulator [Spirosoma taeanense]
MAVDRLIQARSAKPTILVLEDNADQWFLIRWVLLQKFPEVEPVWMSDSTQAILYLESCSENEQELPRLILLDLYLPTCQVGFNFAQIIKSHYRYREIPVVMLSWSHDPDDIRKSYRCGVNSFITKPATNNQWLDCFGMLRQYWWDITTLPNVV